MIESNIYIYFSSCSENYVKINLKFIYSVGLKDKEDISINGEVVEVVTSVNHTGKSPEYTL